MSALILMDDSCGTLRFAGRDLTERAVLVARRAGIRRIALSVVPELPFASAWWTDVVLVLSPSTIIEHTALTALLRRVSLAPGGAMAVDVDGQHAGILVLSRKALETVRGVHRVEDALHHLARLGLLHTVAVEPDVCAQVEDRKDVVRLERAYRWAKLKSWRGVTRAAVLGCWFSLLGSCSGSRGGSRNCVSQRAAGTATRGRNCAARRNCHHTPQITSGEAACPPTQLLRRCELRLSL